MSDEYTTPVPNVIDLTDYSDPSVNLDDIPISERISGRELCGLPPVEDIRAGEFLRMPLSRYMSDRMPPVARLLLVLEWRYCLHGPDFDAGWVQFSHRLYGRALLQDPQVRRRGVRKFEKLPGCEVDRAQGRSALLRLTEHSSRKATQRAKY